MVGFSALSDKIGRRPVCMGAAIFSALSAFPFFMLVNTQSMPLIWFALTMAISFVVGGMFGPQAAYFAELFGPRIRYSGFAFARELGSILAGGPTARLGVWRATWWCCRCARPSRFILGRKPIAVTLARTE